MTSNELCRLLRPQNDGGNGRVNVVGLHHGDGDAEVEDRSLQFLFKQP